MEHNVLFKKAEKNGLYDSRFEHDNCGIGAVVNIKGKRSHETVVNALKIVENLEHRAGKDAEGKTGDGVGIMLQISHKFFKKVTKPLGIHIGEEREYGVGMFFMPQDDLTCKSEMKMLEIITEKEGLEFLGWREVPVNPDVLGSRALECMPRIMQCFIKKPEDVEKGLAFDRKLYIVRRVFSHSNAGTYTVSMSSRTIVYKGMFLVDQLGPFFADLMDKSYESAIALVHSRFSTNTQPSWKRAHPNRFIVHNGEINTIRGNADNMLAREESMSSEYMQSSLQKVMPVVDVNGSDSAMLDNTLEFLVMNGVELPLAVMMCIPEPWEKNDTISQTKRDFYQYYATMMEPWDGPASILFTDGDYMGAILDRNGLRPSRYYITSDDQLILSSEVGVLDIAPEKIVVKERLRPGRMLLVDTVNGKLIDDDELKERYAVRRPYGEWLNNNLVYLRDINIPNVRVESFEKEELQRLQKNFGYTFEDLKRIIPMANNGIEATKAMGKDTPLAVLSKRNHPLFNYFKQLFAQVTNPPIDAIREEIVTSTSVYIGNDGNILEEQPENCNVLKIKHPILTNTDILKLKNIDKPGFKSAVVPIVYYKGINIEKAIEQVFVDVDKAHKDGANIIILSDRGVDEYHVQIPSLLAVSAVHQYLVRTKKRTTLSLVLESGEPRDVHHFATLLGYGASAINPYLAHETIKQMVEEEMINKDPYAAIDDYNGAVLGGIIKIASKMGISTIQSYQGSQIFEAIGISKEVVDKYFTGTVSRVEGITIKDIENGVEELHSRAFDPLGLDVDLTLESNGEHKARSGKEQHKYNPVTIHTLQQATWTDNYQLFKQYTHMIDEEMSPFHLRGLMDFSYPENGGISIDEVESAESIMKRFKTGAMSYGSISQEAHETMAIAMNMIGGRSNSGEGGESIERLSIGEDGLNKCSKIKQVASGRFGVTSRYLVSAEELQIKMAQGAKPGEGGHLPGKKVYPWVAKTRHSTPGVSLISPPPHHDIYSIEDLAQLIYDLKNSNRDARISVKLVSEAGVGTVAAGVAKAGAQVILVSGFDGGTGAAPENSIYNAGLPWELGLAEAHQTLIANGLRHKVIVETDGKLMSGRDVAIAAMLGAEEYGFATAPLVTMGCVMMRVCNLDTCPVGVATQNPELRKNFKGKPEYVVNFMKFIAEELREYMAKLGVKTLDELVGRVDLLKVKDGIDSKRAAEVDLSKILNTDFAQERVQYLKKNEYDFELEKTKDMTVILPKLQKALNSRKAATVEVNVTNIDRSLGTIFGSEITKKYQDTLEDDMYTVKAYGAGGQSFGAFIPNGMTMELTGDSNDYLGKGLSGGKIIVKPPKESTFKQDENIIIGNVAFYGATSGMAFINGVAGERFCVRNSGVTAVVEGVGDHGCEYMTGGCVAVIGKVGKNFAAGMSGGVAYVLDENNDLYRKTNKSLVSTEEVSNKYDVLELKGMIEEHVKYTDSEKGKLVLDKFEEYLPKFKKIISYDYKKMLKTIAKMEQKGLNPEQAQIEAFYEATR